MSNTDSGGRSDMPAPDLRPPDTIAEPVPVLCPACMGKVAPVVEGASRPAMAIPCPHCRGSHKVEMGWSSHKETPEHVHLVWVRALIQVNIQMAYWLCEPGSPVLIEDMTRPTGSPCMNCVLKHAALLEVARATGPMRLE